MANASLQAKTGSGLLFYKGTGDDPAAATWTHIEGMKSGTFPSPDKPEIDCSDTESLVREYIPGLGTIPDLALEFNFFPGNEIHQEILAEAFEQIVRPWKIEGLGISCSFLGYLKSASPTFSIDAAMTLPLSFKVTSKPTYIYTSGGQGGMAWNSTLVGSEGEGSVAGSLVGTFASSPGITASFVTTIPDGSDFTRNLHYTIENLPSGLVPKLTKTSGTVATLTLTGTATDTEDVTNIVISMLTHAFSGITSVSKVNRATKIFAITFSDLLAQ